MTSHLLLGGGGWFLSQIANRKSQIDAYFSQKTKFIYKTMTIVLERKSFTEKETRGIIKIGESYLGYTLEPPVLDYASDNELTALPSGEYTVVLRNNPVAGSPCIKIIGITHSCTSTIRCCKPLGKRNASIVLLSDPDGKGTPMENNTKPWLELLINVFDSPQTTLIIK